MCIRFFFLCAFLELMRILTFPSSVICNLFMWYSKICIKIGGWKRLMLSKSPAHFWFGVCEASLSVQRAWAAAVGRVWMDGRGFCRQTRLCLTASTHPVSSVHLLYYTLSQAVLCSAARWHRDAAHTSTVNESISKSRSLTEHVCH